MFKKIKLLLQAIKSLEDRLSKLEQQYQVMWEETHPPTMGGK